MSCHELSTFSQTSLGFIWSGYLACWMSDGLALLGCHEVTSSHNVSLPGPTWSFWKNTPMSALNQPLKSLGKSAFSFWYLLMLFGSEPTTAVRRFLGYKWGSRSKRYKRRTWIHLIDLIWLVDTLHLGPLGLRCEDKSVLVCIDWSNRFCRGDWQCVVRSSTRSTVKWTLSLAKILRLKLSTVRSHSRQIQQYESLLLCNWPADGWHSMGKNVAKQLALHKHKGKPLDMLYLDLFIAEAVLCLCPMRFQHWSKNSDKRQWYRRHGETWEESREYIGGV